MLNCEKYMEKNTSFIIFIILIFCALCVGIWFYISQSNNSIKIDNALRTISPTGAINANVAMNKNKYPLHMIEGKLNKIIGKNPFKIDVRIRVSKIFSDESKTDKTLSVITNKDTQYLVRSLKTSVETPIKHEDLSVGDDIVIWIKELNTDILSLTQFTATRIILYKQ